MSTIKAKVRDKSPATAARKPASKVKAAPKAAAKAAATPERATAKEGSRQIDEKIRSLGDWRAGTLSAIRGMIHDAAPDILEACKWVKASNPAGVPVWSQAGMVCTGEAYQQVVKLTFARGASLDDPRQLFNSSLDGGTRRAIDIREGEELDPKAFKALIRAAIDANVHSKAGG